MKLDSLIYYHVFECTLLFDCLIKKIYQIFYNLLRTEKILRIILFIQGKQVSSPAHNFHNETISFLLKDILSYNHICKHVRAE